MKRDEEIRTPLGHIAWRFYQTWLAKNRRHVLGIHSFVKSRLYNTFIKFATFVKNRNIPEPDMYIGLMVLKKYRPEIWTDDIVYREYLETLDRTGDPYRRAEDTIKAIQKISNDENCKLHEVFDHMTAPEVIHGLYTRQLSPWILLNSQKFLKFCNTTATPIEKIKIEQIIRVPFWREQFQKNPDAYKDLKNIVKRLNL